MNVLDLVESTINVKYLREYTKTMDFDGITVRKFLRDCLERRVIERLAVEEEKQGQLCRCGNPAMGELSLHGGDTSPGIVFDEFMCRECMIAKLQEKPLPEFKGFYISKDEAEQLRCLMLAIDDFPTKDEYFTRELQGRLYETD